MQKEGHSEREPFFLCRKVDENKKIAILEGVPAFAVQAERGKIEKKRKTTKNKENHEKEISTALIKIV